jgi:hypothetical protein
MRLVAGSLDERNPHLYQHDAERIVTFISDEIVAALWLGDRLPLNAIAPIALGGRPEPPYPPGRR